MITVGTREIKNRLSEYLRRAKAGERIIVTERGRPVAVITRPGAAEERIEGMIRERQAFWGGGKPRGSRKPPDQRPVGGRGRHRGPPLRLYLDTSSLVKLYVEDGSSMARKSVDVLAARKEGLGVIPLNSCLTQKFVEKIDGPFPSFRQSSMR